MSGPGPHCQSAATTDCPDQTGPRQTLLVQSSLHRAPSGVTREGGQAGHNVLAFATVEMKLLNRAVRRNQNRFPPDCMFQLTKQVFELCRNEILRLQNGTSNVRSHIGTSRWDGRRYVPLVLTERRDELLSVLNSECAIQVNIQTIRIFTKLSKLIVTHKDLWQKIQDMERQYDKKFKVAFRIIAQLVKEDEAEKTQIGFQQ